VADAARAAALPLRALSGGERSRLLTDMASSIRAHEVSILDANRRDVAAGEGLAPALRDRLALTSARVEAMAAAVDAVATQTDPVGRVVDGRVLANGIRLEKRRVPIGVVLVIYESRPNVTSDAAALCLRSGNAVILKGGSEAMHSNRAIVEAIRAPLRDAGLNDAVSFVDTSDRSAVTELVRMRGVIDLAIPRGGPGLIRAVTEAALIPVVKHDAGNCHIYIDQHLAGLEDTARDIVINAKAQRPGVCNAVETVLVHRDVADRVVPPLCRELAAAGVEVRGDDTVQALVSGVAPATESDWDTEYLELILAMRVVDSLEDACAHIRRHGSQHTECIVTTSIEAADRFIARIDSANVMINCSTRFADGGEYGLGAEIGISTDKLHARGPMGAEDLTTFQWVLQGSGQTRT
ncbi:MAG: glutamate-5-semialdehyde dehydrogenase, partial [Phycisphaerales bacterium]|nr:glutamate-5-semialdehyde dehydrogenase [Phycisphaerales bacterium]